MLSRWEKGMAFTLLLEAPRVAEGHLCRLDPRELACSREAGTKVQVTAAPLCPSALFIGLLDISADSEMALSEFWGSGGAGLLQHHLISH